MTRPFESCGAVLRKFFTRISNQAPASKTAVKLDAVGQAVARSLQSYNEFGWRQRLFVAG